VAADLPTLIVWGAQDALVPLAAAQDYKRAIRGSKVVVFEACGHRPEIEKSAEFVREIQSFLE
jgi:pimeloyl-ACP methyl ester carboxylesterase